MHRKGSTFHHYLQLNSVSTLYTPYPNMLRKSAAHQKKVDSAVRVLQTTTGVKVPWAMILAGFSKSDSADEIVCQQGTNGRHGQYPKGSCFRRCRQHAIAVRLHEKNYRCLNEKITQLLLAIILLAIRHLLPPYLRRRPPPSRRAFITLHSLALRRPPTALVPCRRPPPLSSRRPSSS